jgi:hypothetical protein
MARKRKVESDDERAERMKKDAHRATEDATAADDDIDAMVKRSIALYGA